ncbi:MAG: phosphopentomutase [candidate division Zixibacteria bacterium]|nr:phosphopentomutase [candidate division Zixibacteria bacterium]
MKFKRGIILVIDACGVGELPDAADYGDTGSATIPNVAKAAGGLNMPNCQKLGLGNIVEIEGVPPAEKPAGSFGKMAERAAGKDSTSGHWEMAGVVIENPFPTFPDGFPRAIVERFEKAANVKTIGNVAASGTEIIEQLGKEHIESGAIILYTSADSVFQLAAHEDILAVERLYEICAIAREMLTGEFGVGRVIARPFVGQPGNFRRTARRRDFSLVPPSDTILDLLHKSGRKVLSIGKIYDLFVGRGIAEKIKTADNNEVMQNIIEAIENSSEYALIFANCVDFDEKWGHRNDEKNFARSLEEFDVQLGELLGKLCDDDLLIITADHGCDPTIKTSTDHSREYVPLLVYGKNARAGVNLGTRETFADVACTLAEMFRLENGFPGISFLESIT